MILGTSRAVSVFAYPAPVGLRKGYDGLYGPVQTGLRRDPSSRRSDIIGYDHPRAHGDDRVGVDSVSS